MSYKETYYVVISSDELTENILDCIECRFDTLEEAKQWIDELVRYYGCSYEECEIVRITTTLERGIK